MDALLKEEGKNVIRDTSSLERNVAATTWCTNIPRIQKFADFLPFSTEVTSDATQLSPNESYVYSSTRDVDLEKKDDGSFVPFTSSKAYSEKTVVPRQFVSSLSAASTIQDSIAQFQMKIYSILVDCKLAAIMASNHNEYGGHRPKESMLKKAVSNTRLVTRALNQLEILKKGSDAAFRKAVTVDRSEINVCFSAWAAGLVASIQTTIQRMVDRYVGGASGLATAGMHLPNATRTYDKSSQQNREEFIKSINDDLEGLCIDTAARTFNAALKRCLREFIHTANSEDIHSTYRNILRQTRHANDPSVSLGMLTPRDSVQEIASNDRQHRRSHTDHEEDEKVAKVARLFKRNLPSDDLNKKLQQQNTAHVTDEREWSLHMTQLFTQAFLESVTSLLALTFGVIDPFSAEGFDRIGAKIISTQASETSRRIKMNTYTLIDKHLLGVGNFYLGFIVTPDNDILEGRRVTLNTPVLAAITKPPGLPKGEIKAHLTDRLLVTNKQIDECLKETTNNGSRLIGCTPVLNAKSFSTDATSSLFQSLAMDWFYRINSLGATGKIGATVAAGVLSALESPPQLVDKDGKLVPSETAKTRRATTRHSMKLLTLMGQSLSTWNHSGHNDSLNTFWSKGAAVRSLARQSNMAERLAINPKDMDNAERIMRSRLLTEFSKVNSFDPLLAYDDRLAGSNGALSTEHKHFLRLLTQLPKAVSEVLNVRGFKEVLSRFKLPLVRNGTTSRRNQQALDHLLSALSNMTLQSVVNVLDQKDNPRQGVDNLPSLVVEPVRMRALNNLSNHHRRWSRALELENNKSSNIVIPVCPVKGAVAGPGAGFGQVDNIILPVPILTRLISDKIKLDQLCALLFGENTHLHHTILDLVKSIVCGDEESSRSKSFFSSIDQNDFVTLVSYLWFNTAIVSLTDTHATSIINLFSRGLGTSIYRDFTSVRRLIDWYYDVQTKFTTGGIIQRHSRLKSISNTAVKRLSNTDIEEALDHLTTNLAAFTSTDDDGSTVKSIENVDQVRRLRVRVEPSEYKKLSFFLKSLNSFLETALTLKVIAKHAPNCWIDMENLVRLQATNFPSADSHRTFRVELKDCEGWEPYKETQLELIEKQLQDIEDKGYTEQISATKDETELERLHEQLARLDETETDPDTKFNVKEELNASIRSLTRVLMERRENMNKYANADLELKYKKENMEPAFEIFIAPDFTLATFIALARNVHQEYPGLELFASSVKYLSEKLPAPDGKTDEAGVIDTTVGEVPDFVQRAILVGLWMMRVMADTPDILTIGVNALADLSLALEAEATLAVSREQKTFAPIPPAAFAMSTVFNPTKETFAKMSQSFLATAVNTLVDDGSNLKLDNRDDDSLTAEKLKLVADKYNQMGGDGNEQQQQQQQQQNRGKPRLDIKMDNHLTNPVDVFSERALPHFDQVIKPIESLPVPLSPDDLRRLSAIYQGMAIIPVSADPGKWDTTLSGNMSGSSLPRHASSFNLALDSVIANPSRASNIVARELVNYASTIVSQRAEILDALDDCLGKGKTAVLPTNSSIPGGVDPILMKGVKETILAMTEQDSTSVDKNEIPATILEGWNTLSTLTWPDQRLMSSPLFTPVTFSHIDDLSVHHDLVRQHLDSVPAFKRRLVEATRSLYEMSVLTCILSEDGSARKSARSVLARISERSPVLHEIRVGRVANLVSALASPSQYRHFLNMVANEQKHQNGMFSNPDVYMRRAREDGPEELGLKRKSYDSFWKNVYSSECGYMSDTHHGVIDSDSRKRFRSVVNTYASLATNAVRDSKKPTSTQKSKEHKEIVGKIAEYIKRLVEVDADNIPTDKTLDQLAAAQQWYSKLSTVMTNAVFNCQRGEKRHARNESDSLLSALLQELAPKVDERVEGKAMALGMATMSHIIAGKVVLSSISTESPFSATYRQFLAAAGVTAHTSEVARRIFDHLSNEDFSLFLGGSLLQRGLFVSFFLNNILFGRIDPSTGVKDLSKKARCQLLKLVGFCGALRTLFSEANRDTHGPGATEASIALAVSNVQKTLKALKRKPNRIFRGEIRRLLFSPTNTDTSIPPIKKYSSLNDILGAGSSVGKARLANYPERALKSRLARYVRRRQLNKKINTGETSLLDCMNSDLKQARNNDTMTSARQRQRPVHLGWDYEDMDVLLDSDDDSSGEIEDDESMEYEDDQDDSCDSDWPDDDELIYDPLRHMGEFRHFLSEDSDSDEDDDEDEDEDNGHRRRAENLVYGAGFLTSSLESLRGNESSLQQLIMGDDSDYSLSDEDDTDDSFTWKKKLTRAQRLEKMNSILREFAPKEVTMERGRITSVCLSDPSRLVRLLAQYSLAKREEKKKLRKEHDIGDGDDSTLPNTYMSRRVEKPRDLQATLVRNTARVLRTLEDNRNTLRESLFDGALTQQKHSEVLDNIVLFGSHLDCIIEKRNELVKKMVKSSPTLLGPFVPIPERSDPPGGLPMFSVDGARRVMRKGVNEGYLSVPVSIVSGALIKEDGVEDFTKLSKTGSFLDAASIKQKRMSHLDWLTVSALTLCRSYRITTGFAVDELVRSRNALNDMRGALETLIESPNELVNVKSTLLHDIINMRMVHTYAGLGLTGPVIFMNQPLPSGSNGNLVEAQMVTVFRGVNSGQLSKENGVTDTTSLLDFLSKRTRSKVGSMSLYDMSVVENLGGPARDRLKGAVSLEVGEAAETCTNDIFSKRSAKLGEYCRSVGFSPLRAVGPLNRFLPTGTLDTPVSVTRDPTYHRLREAEEEPGIAIVMSAVGNLYGMIDAIARLSARCIEAVEAVAQETCDDEKEFAELLSTKLHERTKGPLKLSGPKEATLAPTNAVPVFSDTMLVTAAAVRSSISTILSNVSNQFDFTASMPGSVKVTMRKFRQLVETITALGHHKTHLMGLANRLAAAQYELEKIQKMHNMGLSESIGAFVAVATTMGPYSATANSNNAKEWLSDLKLIRVLVGRELYNVKCARQHIDRCISAIDSMNSRLEILSKSCYNNVNVDESHVSKCGGFITHPETQLLLCLDDDSMEEDCRNPDAIKRNLDDNTLAVTKARLAALRIGRPEIGSIFSVNQADLKPLDTLINSLTKSISSAPDLDGLFGKSKFAAQSAVSRHSGLTEVGMLPDNCSRNGPVDGGGGTVKSIAYIPVMFENRYRQKENENHSAEKLFGRQLLQAGESRNLAAVLKAHSRHKFGGYNQASIVSIFSRSKRPSVLVAKEDTDMPKGVFAGLDVGPTKPESRLSSLQLPPNQTGLSTTKDESKDNTKVQVRKIVASGAFGDLEEYQQLQRIHEQVSRALKIQGEINAVVVGGGLVVGNEMPILNDSVRADLSTMLATKTAAEDSFKKLLTKLSDNVTPSNTSEKHILSLISHHLPDENQTPNYSKLEYTIKSTPQVRIPLLLGNSLFSTSLRAVVDDLGKYYKGLDELSLIVKAAVEKAEENAENDAKQLVELDSNSIIPAFAEAKGLLQRELDTVQSAHAEVVTKATELKGLANIVQDSIDKATEHINTGNTLFAVPDFLALQTRYSGEASEKEQMKTFAERHSGTAFSVNPSLLSTGDDQKTGNALLKSTAKAISIGEEKLKVNFESAIDVYPDDMKLERETYTFLHHRKREEARLESVNIFIDLLNSRSNLLLTRAEEIQTEVDNLDKRYKESSYIYVKQLESRRQSLKESLGVIATTLKTHIGSDRAQAAGLVPLGVTVDRLLSYIEAVETVTGEDAIREGAERSEPETIADAATTKNDQQTESIQPFSCFLEPLHCAISRVRDMFKDGKGVLTRDFKPTKADVQFKTLIEWCCSHMDQYGKRNYEKTASRIVNGLCELCAMLLFNLHTPIHASDHKFSFDNIASRKRLRELLEAALSTSAEESGEAVRDRVLALMESNNGSVKELAFTLKQRVACFTPVNTALGGAAQLVWPNTVVLPTSELFDCPSLAYDKFRSMATRSWDSVVASAPKRARSIVNTLAGMTPATESLYYPCKDERRFFNSICDGVIEGMGPRASSVFNTTCDQSLTLRDAKNGLPIFVGRQNNTAEADAAPERPPRDEKLDMGASFVVAPGANLNRYKEERFRVSNLNDLNNVRHLNTNVHLAASSITNRVVEVLQSAVGDDNGIRPEVTRSLLLGSVANLMAEKSAPCDNDPTQLIESYQAAKQITDHTIGNRSLGSDIENIFSTQVAYRHRLFPACVRQLDKGSAETGLGTDAISACDLLHCYPRYRSARACLEYNEGCADRFEENPHLLREVRGLMSDETRTRMVTGADWFNSALAASQNRVFNKWSTVERPNVGFLASNIADASTDDRSELAANLAADVMADSIVDTLSVLSAAVSGQGTVPLTGTTIDKGAVEKLSSDVERVATAIGSPGILSSTAIMRGGASTFSAMLTATNSATTEETNSQNSISATRRILSNMYSHLDESSARLNALVGSGRRLDEVRQLYDTTSSLALQLNEEAAAANVHSLREEMSKYLLRSSIAKVRRAVGATNMGWDRRSKNSALSSLLDREDAADGRLCFSATDRGHRIASGIDEFNTVPLLSRYVALDSDWSPLPLSKETRRLLLQPKAATAKALLSERSNLLTELVMYNTRDTPIERAVDRILLQPYLVQHAKRFDNVDSTFPLALTGSTHCMLSAMDVRDKPHSLLANLKLHLSDTTCFFKNIERFEKLTGRHGDSYAMTHHQNCNCPFQLHHDFDPSVDEALVPSFAYARPEITQDEVYRRPYQAQRILNDKHYIMAITKVDPTITGAAILRRVSEWSEMGAGTRYVGTLEPSRATLAGSIFKTAGVNLDVIVRPSNAKGVLGILGCHRQHVCGTTAKLCSTTSMPSAFQDNKNHASDMLQMALPHNAYIQKSKMNASSIVFTNVLERLTECLGREILADLGDALLVGDSSIPSTASANAAAALASLASLDAFKNGGDAGPVPATENKKHTRLMDTAMREMVYRSIRQRVLSDKSNVPFADESAATLAFDFLTDDGTSMEDRIKAAGVDSNSSPESRQSSDVDYCNLLDQLSSALAAILPEVSAAQCDAILDNVDARVAFATGSDKHKRAKTKKGAFAEALNAEFTKVLAYLRVLKTNVIPILTGSGPIGKKVALFMSLLSCHSRIENMFKFVLSNSGSTDLSHLQPLTKMVHVEDTLLYSKVHPLLAMALPNNCAALLQQEQTDPTLAIRLRKPLATFLNHPNSKHMARSARASIGAGGGHAMGMFPSSLVLHEMTIATSDSALDTDSKDRFHESDTRDPLVVLNPFKKDSGLLIDQKYSPFSDCDQCNYSHRLKKRNSCSYLQVSMPTQFSGVVTNTGVNYLSPNCEHHTDGTTRTAMPHIKPVVLCSDAISNVLDGISRADMSLENINVRFGFMPELITAIAAVQNQSERAIIDSMIAATASSPRAKMDPSTGDIEVSGGIFPTPETLTPGRIWRRNAAGEGLAWGVGGKLEARLLPRMFVDNPLAIASINGVPLTEEGRQLASDKYSTSIFEGGPPMGGLLPRQKSAITHEHLEPLRASWNELVTLRNKISATGTAIRDHMKNNKRDNNYPEANETVNELYSQYSTLTKALEVVAQETTKMIAASDMMFGGSGGDPATALICSVKPESLGILGAISSPIRTGVSAFVDSVSRGISALNDAFRNKLVLSSSGGRVQTEHGLTYGMGEELIRDRDSIAGKLARTAPASDEPNWRQAAIRKILPPDNTCAASLMTNAIIGVNGNETKRQSIEVILLSNETLLDNVMRAFACVRNLTNTHIRKREEDRIKEVNEYLFSGLRA